MRPAGHRYLGLPDVGGGTSDAFDNLTRKNPILWYARQRGSGRYSPSFKFITTYSLFSGLQNFGMMNIFCNLEGAVGEKTWSGLLY